LLRSEACFAEVIFSLAPEFVLRGSEAFLAPPFFVLTLLPDFVQVFVKGRRPVWPTFLILLPDFVQVFFKGRGPVWPIFFDLAA